MSPGGCGRDRETACGRSGGCGVPPLMSEPKPRGKGKQVNAQKIARITGLSVEEVRDEVQRGVMDSVAIAVCEDLCEVEPDGYCEHGKPSIVLAMGLI